MNRTFRSRLACLVILAWLANLFALPAGNGDDPSTRFLGEICSINPAGATLLAGHGEESPPTAPTAHTGHCGLCVGHAWQLGMAPAMPALPVAHSSFGLHRLDGIPASPRPPLRTADARAPPQPA